MSIDRWLVVLRLRLRSLLWRDRVEQELAEEFAHHLETQAASGVARGLAAEEAHRSALRQFDGVERWKDACRDARGTTFLESLAADARIACRTLRHQPGYALPALLTIALGIGVNTAVFGLVHGILLAELPFPSPQRLAGVSATYPVAAFDAARAELRTLDLAAYAVARPATLEGVGPATSVSAAPVSAELFSVLGASPALGRSFRAGEDRAAADRVLIISDGLWTSRFGRDRGILGRTVVIDGVAREIVGVMPGTFRFPSARVQLWIPAAIDSRAGHQQWAGDFMPILGRLRPGATMDQAQADVRAFQSRIVQRFPWPMPDDWNRDLAVVPLRDAIAGPVRPRLLLVAAAALCVLLIACANVASLSLSRSAVREREIGIRAAIGAGPRRIARQLLTESLILAFLGGLLGLALAWPSLAVLVHLLPADTPRLAEVAFDWRALAVTALLAATTGCAFGLAPVLHARRLQLRAALESGGRSGGMVAGRARRVLTIAQIGCAVLLVAAAALLVRSLWSLVQADPGFQADGVLTARIAIPDSRCAQPEACIAAYRALEDAIAAAGGASGVALVNDLPLTGVVTKRALRIQGVDAPQGSAEPLFRLNVVTPGYLPVMGIRVHDGRGFAEADRAGAPVAIVSAQTARRYWPKGSPIGAHVRFSGEQVWRTVVGVAGDVRAHDLLHDEPEWIDGTIYVPHRSDATREDGRLPAEMQLVARTEGSGHLASWLQRLNRGDVVVSDVRPLASVLQDAAAGTAATTILLAAAATLAMLLGIGGVYAVLSYLVSRQTRELGIRLAVGAHPLDLCWLVVGEGARLCVAGLAIGTAGALLVSRWLASELHGVSATDPLTYLVVATGVSLATLLACLVPTRRAMRVDPLIVLRDG
jgi:predicted permease